MRSQAIIAHLAAGAILTGASVLRTFPPETSRFYPECPVFHFFHVLCPGCGATRALAALTHARLAEAFHYNGLIVILCPLLLAYFVAAYWRAMKRESFVWPTVPAPVVSSLCAIALLFCIVRNVFHFAI